MLVSYADHAAIVRRVLGSSRPPTVEDVRLRPADRKLARLLAHHPTTYRLFPEVSLRAYARGATGAAGWALAGAIAIRQGIPAPDPRDASTRILFGSPPGSYWAAYYVRLARAELAAAGDRQGRRPDQPTGDRTRPADRRADDGDDEVARCCQLCDEHRQRAEAAALVAAPPARPGPVVPRTPYNAAAAWRLGATAEQLGWSPYA